MSKENVIPIKGYSEQLNAEHDWWVFPSSVDTDICKQIITLGEDKWKDAKITNSLQSEEKLNKTIRDTQVTFCDEDWLYKIVWDYLHTANKKSNWNFQIDSCESMQIGKYGVGDITTIIKMAMVLPNTLVKINLQMVKQENFP